MTKAQKELYVKIENELAAEIEDKLSGEVDELTVSNVLTQLLRLAQITSGYVTYDPVVNDDGDVVRPRREVRLNPGKNPKIEELMALLHEDRDPRAKTIVWCQFINNIHEISDALNEAGIKHGCYFGAVKQDKRDEIVDAFNNDPEFRVIIANPQTAGEGLNLLGYDVDNAEESDTYCDMEVFFSSGWSAILRGQAEDRAHRRGTRMPVQIIDLVAPGTIDEEILDRVLEKREMADTVADLRATLSRVLNHN